VVIINKNDFYDLISESEKRISLNGYIDDDGVEHKSLIAEAADKLEAFLAASNLTETEKAKRYTELLTNVVTSTLNSLIGVCGDIVKNDPLIAVQTEREKREALILDYEMIYKAAQAGKMEKEAGIKIEIEETTLPDGSISREITRTDTGEGFIDREIQIKEKELEIKEQELELTKAKLWATAYDAAQSMAGALRAGAEAASETLRNGGSASVNFDSDGKPIVTTTSNLSNSLLQREIELREAEIALKAAQTASVEQTQAGELALQELRNSSAETVAYIQAVGDYPPTSG
jgi:hypothetical protein